MNEISSFIAIQAIMNRIVTSTNKSRHEDVVEWDREDSIQENRISTESLEGICQDC